MSPLESRAKAAFDAYSAAVGGKTYDGKDIPSWGGLSDNVRAGWMSAVIAVTATLSEYKQDASSAVPMTGLTPGRIVHYVLPDGMHRAAIIVHVWDVSGGCPGYVNLQVFTDGANDLSAFFDANGETREQITDGRLLRFSVCYSEGKEPGTWHWIERA